MDDEQAILRAAFDILSERGFSGATLDEVIVQAQVHPSGVYRRWRSRSELAAELLRQEAANAPELPDNGELRADLLAVLEPLLAWTQRLRPILTSVIGESWRDSELAAELRLFVNSWGSAPRQLVTRAVERGELPPTTDVDSAVELLASVVWFKLIVQFEPGIDRSPERIVDPILGALRHQTAGDVR
jgi:AcrR family transcriptional regulator